MIDDLGFYDAAPFSGDLDTRTARMSDAEYAKTFTNYQNPLLVLEAIINCPIVTRW